MKSLLGLSTARACVIATSIFLWKNDVIYIYICIFFVAELLTQQVVDRSESVAQCNKQNKISAGKCKGNPRSEVLEDVAV